MARTVLFLLAIVGSTLHALDFDKADGKTAYKNLQAFIAESIQAGVRDGAPKKMKLNIAGTVREYDLVGCTEEEIQIRLDGRIQAWKWFRFNHNETVALGVMCIDGDPARARLLADWCAATNDKANGDAALALASKLSSEQGARASRTRSIDFEVEWRPDPVKIAFRPSTPDALTPPAEASAAVDNIIDLDLSDLGIAAEPLCDDLTFLRRVSLDLTGQIPSPEEVLAFYKDATVNKRVRKVQELLARAEFADHWSTQLQIMLVGRQPPDRFDNHSGPLRTFLREELRQNRPYDEIAYSLLTATGNDGPAGYLAHHLQNTSMPATADKVARDFLGKRIACAQCHDHPFDHWTQNDFWSFAAFLGCTDGNYNGVTDIDQRFTGPKYEPPAPEYLLPPLTLSGDPIVEPREPTKEEAETDALRRNLKQNPEPAKPQKQMRGYKRRVALAEYVTDKTNRDFDRAAVNRAWKMLFGHGLVEPVDDLRPKNGASHPQVLDLLANEFAASGRDFKRLLQTLVLTNAYQRSSSGKAVKGERFRQVRFAGRAEVRPLTPEMLFIAIMKATLGEEKVREVLRAMSEPGKVDMYGRLPKVGPNAQQFYNLLQRFFTKSDTAAAMDDALQFEGSFTQALMMMNSDLMNRAIRDATSKNARRGTDMTYLFALTLGRPPTADEQKLFKDFKGGLEEILWILLNSAEFVTIR